MLLGMDLFIPSSYKPGKKNSPKWFNSQCAKAVNNKNHYFKEWKRLQTQHSRTSFIHSPNTCSKPSKIPSHLLSNASTTKSLPARLALTPFGLCPKLSPKTVANHLSLHQTTTLTLLLPLLHPRPIFSHQSLPPTPTWTTKGSNLITFPLQNSLCHQLSSPHETSSKPFSSLTPPNPKALMVFQQ